MEDYSILNDITSIKSQPSRIMAMGVGGAGGNAIEHISELHTQLFSSFVDDLNADSLDLVEIVLEGEEKLNITFENDEVITSNAQKIYDKLISLKITLGSEFVITSVTEPEKISSVFIKLIGNFNGFMYFPK